LSERPFRVLPRVDARNEHFWRGGAEGELRFLRCNAWHAALVVGFSGGPTLNHVAFEMPDLDSVMRGIGRMRDHGYPVEWGPGRHGPGDNVFAYFCGPE
jgi:hypothetical protein